MVEAMGRLFLLGEEHVKPDAHSAIHEMLKNNPNLLFLTEKRADVLELRKALAQGERQHEGLLLGQHEGNFALQRIFDDASVHHENIHSIDADGTTSLFLAKKTDQEVQEFLRSDVPQETINGSITESDKYDILTSVNEGLIVRSNGSRLIIRELRNKIMANNIASFIEENPEKDIVVLCGAAHLCRTDLRSDQPALSSTDEGRYRKSLIDYLSEKGIVPERVDGIYLEDNPQDLRMNLPLRRISTQIQSLYPTLLKSFSLDLAVLTETLKANQQPEVILSGAIATPLLFPQQEVTHPESKAEEVRKREEEHKTSGDSGRL